MKKCGLLLSLVFIYLLFVFSCASEPASAPPSDPPVQAEQRPVGQAGIVQETIPEAAQAEEEYFDPASVSEDLYVSTLSQVQALIGELNGIIRTRNFNIWVSHLSDAYYQEINSREFLDEQEDQLFRLDVAIASSRGVRAAQVPRRELATAVDYFNFIVGPARQNDRVDDIEFITDDHVIAYTVDARGNRLILYSLQIIDGRWKINR